MKGQSTIEFVGAMLLFLIAVVSSLTVISGKVPQFTEDLEDKSQNMEMYRVTNTLSTASGRHSYGSGGPNWQKNSSTVSATERIGLAQDYHVLNFSKVRALSTTGSDGLSYGNFREITNLDNQYNFNFTWMPTVETSSSFIRTNPPSNPPINEPNGDPRYSSAENRVHYGSIRINGTSYHFLVAAYDGVYNTVYFDPFGSWNFQAGDKRKVGDTVVMDGRNFTIEKIQNRDRTPGASVILSRNIKTFGVNTESADNTAVKLNRYGVLAANNTDREIVRMEVLSW